LEVLGGQLRDSGSMTEVSFKMFLKGDNVIRRAVPHGRGDRERMLGKLSVHSQHDQAWRA